MTTVTPPSKAMILRRCRFAPYAKGQGCIFHLLVWDTGRVDSRHSSGKSILGYRLEAHAPHLTKHSKHGEKWLLFEGEDFACSPLHAIDSDEMIRSLMSFLTLRPGDTDAEYFANYTQVQLDYCSQDAESLACEVERRYGE